MPSTATFVDINAVDTQSRAIPKNKYSYGEGQLPGVATGVQQGSWEEFLVKLENVDMSGKRVALYGLGNQDKYAARFADSMYLLYDFFKQRGAEIIGSWPTSGYVFEQSMSVVNGQFVGLVLDNHTQALLTDDRIDHWLAQVTPALAGSVAQNVT